MIENVQAVRWMGSNGVWSRWHATDDNALHTACGKVVVLMSADGSPEHSEVEMVDCRVCLSMQATSHGAGVCTLSGKCDCIGTCKHGRGGHGAGVSDA